eukprot:7223239-Alexandrium_andersonii.AAC.1
MQLPICSHRIRAAQDAHNWRVPQDFRLSSCDCCHQTLLFAEAGIGGRLHEPVWRFRSCRHPSEWNIRR